MVVAQTLSPEVVSNPETAFSDQDDRLADTVLTVELARVPILGDLSRDQAKKAGRALAWHMGLGTALAIVAFAVLGDLASNLRTQGEREWLVMRRLPQRCRSVQAELNDLTPKVEQSLRRRLLAKAGLVLAFAVMTGLLIAWPRLDLYVGWGLSAVVVTVVGVVAALIAQARMGSRSAHDRAAAVVVGLGVAASGLLISAGAAMLAASAGAVAMFHNQSLRGMGITISVAVVGAMAMTKSRGPMRFTQRLLQPVVHARLQQDERRPVMLLRSFQDDALEVRTPNTQLDGLEALAGESYSRFEEIIAWRAWQTGPVLAIGQPGTVLQPLLRGPS